MKIRRIWHLLTGLRFYKEVGEWRYSPPEEEKVQKEYENHSADPNKLDKYLLDALKDEEVEEEGWGTDGHLDVVLGSESSISEIATSVEFTEAYLEAKEAWFRSLADEELRLLWNARHYIERKEAELSRLRTVIRDRLGISRKLYGSDKNNL